MNPFSHSSNHSEVDLLKQRILELEEELEIVGSQKDTLRGLLSDAEAKVLRGKLAYLDLENDYKRERTKRVNLERRMATPKRMHSPASRPSVSLKRKAAATNEVLVEDDTLVVDSSSTNDGEIKEVLEYVSLIEHGDESAGIEPTLCFTPEKRERSRNDESPRSSTKIRSESAVEYMTPIEDKDEPSRKKQKLEESCREDIMLDSNEHREIDHVSTVPRSQRKMPLPCVLPPRQVVDAGPPANIPASIVSAPKLEPKMEGSSAVPANIPASIFSVLKLEPKMESSSAPLPMMPIKIKLPKKKAEGGWSLRSSLVAKYLGSTNVFPISPPPIEVRVSRSALSEAYGLPGMGMLWVSKSKQNPLRVMMPTYEVNPEMPRAPGEPGILLSCREEMCKNGPWTLFIKVEGVKPVRWNYAGEYVSRRVGQMSKEDFKSQDAAVKKVWGEKIAKHKRHAVYRYIRARITMRKATGRNPTNEEVEEEAERIKAKDYTSSLTCEDVIQAFERGAEFINIVKTECVAYHHARAKDYAYAQKTYETIVKFHALLSDAERKRSSEDRKKKRVPATAPVTYIPENLASTSSVQNMDWFFGDSDLTELDESDSDC